MQEQEFEKQKQFLLSKLPDYLKSKGINVNSNFFCLNPTDTAHIPSMSYDASNYTVKCFNCNAVYNIFDLIGIDFNISDFQAANTVSTAADLNIDITGCAAGITGADVLFSGEADTLAPTLLKLTDTGGSGGMATGIAVQILDAQSQQEIPLNQVQPLTPLKAGDNTLKYQLRYKSTKAGATGGNATAVLYFDLVYQ